MVPSLRGFGNWSILRLSSLLVAAQVQQSNFFHQASFTEDKIQLFGDTMLLKPPTYPRLAYRSWWSTNCGRFRRWGSVLNAVRDIKDAKFEAG